MRMQLTPALISTASLDAGNRAMRRAGRTAWSEDDYNAACDENARLYAALDGRPLLKKEGENA